VQKIESALKSDVIDILRTGLEGLANLDSSSAYQAVMNEPTMLHDAFNLFRTQPQLFAAVLVDEQGRPAPPRDDQKLSCGETLGQVITMVVRASARRHFRRKLGGPTSRLVVPAREVHWSRRLAEKLRLVKAPTPPAPKRKVIPGKGDTSYKAMREYLLFDWQAKLIPHYTLFTADMIKVIGRSILDIRDPHELRSLAGFDGREALAQKNLPIFLGGAKNMMLAGGDTIDSELLWTIYDQIGLSRIDPDIDISETRNTIAVIAATSTSAIKQLMPSLGGDVRLFVAFLFVAYRTLGRTVYRNSFVEGGATPQMVKIYVDRITALPQLPVPEMEVMKAVFQEILNRPAPL
jgi:hypothetical protein